MKINVFMILAISLFLLNSLLHLFWKKHKNLTKAFIMPTVLLCCFSVNPSLSPLIIGAAAASWLGDILLEKDGLQWFTAGGTAFIVSHLLYIESYKPFINFKNVPVALVVAVSVLYCAISVCTVMNIRKNVPVYMFPMLLIYLLVNSYMNVSAFVRMFDPAAQNGILIYIGAVLFFTSDNFLYYECFHTKKPNFFLPVMSTYITGQFFITFSSALAAVC